MYMDLSLSMIGDLPAREFEWGNAGSSSHHPCMCGIAIADVSEKSGMLSCGPHVSMQKRVSAAKNYWSIRRTRHLDIDSMPVSDVARSLLFLGKHIYRR